MQEQQFDHCRNEQSDRMIILNGVFARGTRRAASSIISNSRRRPAWQAQYSAPKRFMSSTGQDLEESLVPSNANQQYDIPGADEELGISFYAALNQPIIDSTIDVLEEEDYGFHHPAHNAGDSLIDLIQPRSQHNDESNHNNILDNLDLSCIARDQGAENDISAYLEPRTVNPEQDSGGRHSISGLFNNQHVQSISFAIDATGEEENNSRNEQISNTNRPEATSDITTVMNKYLINEPADTGNITILCQPVNDSKDSSNVAYNSDFNALYMNYALGALKVLSKEKSARERKPMLSIATQTMSRVQASTILDLNINKREWAQANKHAKFPGTGKANLPHPIYFRKRIQEEAVSEFIEWLHASNCLQNLSFGHKVVQYCNGVHTAIEAVKLTKNVRRIIQDYGEMWMSGMQTNTNDTNTNTNDTSSALDDSDEDSRIDGVVDDGDDYRCTVRCTKSKRQCFLPKDHQTLTSIKSHCFTPKGQLSPSSIEKILGQLTAGKIRSLAGLDDTDVEKGTQNFLQMKATLRTLTEVGMFGRAGSSDADPLVKRIEKMEEFHKVVFPRHLGDGT